MSLDRVKLSPLEYLYKKIRNNDTNINLPHSDVYYVRAACEARYNRKFSLAHVEKIMREEGWTDNDGSS